MTVSTSYAAQKAVLEAGGAVDYDKVMVIFGMGKLATGQTTLADAQAIRTLIDADGISQVWIWPAGTTLGGSDGSSLNNTKIDALVL